MTVKVSFEEYRAWLLNPLPGESNPIAQAQQQYPDYTPGSLTSAVFDHNWAAESVLHDLAEYSPWRAARILRHRWTLPLTTHRLNVKQVFQATDHGLQLFPKDEYRADLDKLLRDEDELIDLYGEQLVRHPAMLQNIRVNRSYYLQDGSRFNQEDVDNLDALLNAADNAERRLLRQHLAVLLTPDEYNEVKDLQPQMLEGLYPHIRRHGAEMYQAYLLEARPVAFKNYVWDEGGEGLGLPSWQPRR